jgi:hypothetical protein
METWMGVTMLVEAALLSFLVALWGAWMGLRGLFRVIHATQMDAVPVQVAARAGASRRQAA